MEHITLTERELLRLTTAQRVVDGALRVAQAAKILDLSTRQIKRLTQRLRLQGATAFSAPRSGRPPNNAFEAATRERVLELARTIYAEFGPTFLAEKLAERDEIVVNRETLRLWLIEAKLHHPRRRRQKPRPLRERRTRFGELVQADGSPHRWFEERGEPCSLMLSIDDATSHVTGGFFAEHETTDAYFELFEHVFTKHGLPLALYVDKHSIFRINKAGAAIDRETQVQRAMRELDITLICANSPQAKGRVERANRTFQDRLVKELRLAGISTIPDANRFLPTLLDRHNAQFALPPRDTENAHRSSQGVELDTILTKRYERVLTSNLTFQISDTIYAFDPSPLHRLRTGMRVMISRPRNANPYMLYKGNRIDARFVGARQRTAAVVESKDLNAVLDRRIPNPKKAHIPPITHPWKSRYNVGPLAQNQAARGHL